MFFSLLRAFKTAILTKSFRWLLLTVLVVLGAGTLFYALVERWRIIDALYFCVVTLATIGYGDLTPQTVAGKIFTIVYIFIGIGLLSSLIASIFRAFQKNTQREEEKRKERARQKELEEKKEDAEKQREREERHVQREQEHEARQREKDERRAARLREESDHRD